MRTVGASINLNLANTEPDYRTQDLPTMRAHLAGHLRQADTENTKKRVGLMQSPTYTTLNISGNWRGPGNISLVHLPWMSHTLGTAPHWCYLETSTDLCPPRIPTFTPVIRVPSVLPPVNQSPTFLVSNESLPTLPSKVQIQARNPTREVQSIPSSHFVAVVSLARNLLSVA